jgi:hypothetical protein
MSDFFNSILMDRCSSLFFSLKPNLDKNIKKENIIFIYTFIRGDRISWTGDAHTSQACALVAFSNYDFILESIPPLSLSSILSPLSLLHLPLSPRTTHYALPTTHHAPHYAPRTRTTHYSSHISPTSHQSVFSVTREKTS